MCIHKVILCLSLLFTLAKTYVWKDYNGTIPEDAVFGHFGRYVGQIDLGVLGLLPLTIYPNQREALGELGGKNVYKSNIKILCKLPDEFMYWRYVDVDTISGSVNPKNLVVGGVEREVTLYIGRMFHEYEWKISKVFPPGTVNLGLYLWPKEGFAVEKFNYIEMLFYNH